jgi:hypothetical protein
MTDDEIRADFLPLWNDLSEGDTFPDNRPLLAHYTSIANLELIMKSSEMWFSNPLFMNDLDEMAFVINEGAREFRTNLEFRNSVGEDKYLLMLKLFEDIYGDFANKHAFDVYVLCFSEHDRQERDGLLSMWRGYGGNGTGAAIIFDTAKLIAIEDSPIILAKVEYFTREQRIEWIIGKLVELARLMKEHPVDNDKLIIPVWEFFERLKIFSLFTKHCGFKEEREWRAVYLRERDSSDALVDKLGYAVKSRGVEPKLKFKIEPVEGIAGGNVNLESLVSEIILGPTVSNPLAMKAVQRMLESLGKYELATKLSASSTPYRPI